MKKQGITSKIQKQAAKKSEKGKEKDIKVDSNLFIHFYNWTKQVVACYLLHYMLFVSTAICSLESTRSDLVPLTVIVTVRK